MDLVKDTVIEEIVSATTLPSISLSGCNVQSHETAKCSCAVKFKFLQQFSAVKVTTEMHKINCCLKMTFGVHIDSQQKTRTDCVILFEEYQIQEFVIWPLVRDLIVRYESDCIPI